nr:hypothetical protein [Tanacetum cinerariifolium]
TIDTIIDQQMAMDEALVPHARRLRIRRSNFRLLSNISSKEFTLQLVYDVLRLTPFFKAFLVTTDVSEIYIEMSHICLRLPHQPFVEPSFEEEILAFLRFLRHSGAIRRLTCCISHEDHLLPSSTSGLYQKRNADMWEELIYRVEHKDTKKSNEMYYPRDDHMFTTIKLVSRHQNTQQFGTLLPIELTNEDIRNTNAYKEYYAVATGATPPKLKASVQNNRSSSDTTVTHPTADVGPRLDEESFDPIAKTPENTDDEGNGEENLGINVGKEEGQDEEDEEDELYRDVNINLGRGIQMGDVHQTQEFKDSHVTLTPTPTSVAPLPMSAQPLTPSTIATITTTQQAPIPPTTASSTLLQDLPNFSSLFGFDHRLKTLEANFSKFTQTNQFARAVSSIPEIVHRYMDQQMNETIKTIDENMQKIIKEQVKEQVKTSYAVTADLSEMELKKILIEKMEGNKSIHRSNEQRNLYKALVEAYESDNVILDTYGDTVTLKRHLDDDADKDEEPSAGSDRGSKRRREGKEPESASALQEKATRSVGKSTQGSKSQQTSTSESATVEELMQTTFVVEEPSHLEFETGADDQPIVEPSQHPEWFSQQKKPPTPDPNWNNTLPATHGSIQPWISDLAKRSDSRSSFIELMDTPMDFSAFLINRLKVDTLTLELLAGPTYELMKGSCKSLVELEFILEEVYKETTDQLDWVNPEDYRHIKWIEDLMPRTIWIQEPIGYDKHDLWGISHWGIIAVTELKIVEWHNYKHLDWITVRRDDDKLYKSKEGDFKRLRIQDIEDMLLLLVQGKLTNLTVEERFAFNKKLNLTKPDTYRSDLERKEAYIAYYHPRGFIYHNKDKQNRLMRINELHKFSDGTLTDVRTALDDHLKGIKMKYLPQSIWRKSDKDRAAAMIQAIDKRLTTKIIMRRLERFVGGRLYEGDFRMLQRTI